MTQKWAGGHKTSILCLVDNKEGQTISGAENGEVCFWSKSGEIIWKTDRLIPEAEGVGAEGDFDVGSVCFSQRTPSTLYASVGPSILELDTRNLGGGTVRSHHFNMDTINQVSLDGPERFLAAADDAGHVRVIDLSSHCLHRTLRKHRNICSAAKFWPGRSGCLVSAGLDCALILWDYQQGRPLRVAKMEELGLTSSKSGQFNLNPPLIHSLDISRDGQYLACGLENSSLGLFKAAGKKGLSLANVLAGHSRGVSQVGFTTHDPQQRLVSGGNDGQVLVWEVADAVDSESYASQPPIQRIEHGDKINWVCPSTHNASCLLLADQSHNITVYHLF